MRWRVFVHTAYAEARGLSPLQSGRLWSEFADAAMRLADRVVVHDLTARHGPPLDAQGAPIGRAVCALGKWGSRELNPSSDIDLLLVYGTDDGRAGKLSPHEWFSSWARRIRSLLADADDDGFGFRVDFDLRPEGTTGPVVNSVDALESYYERFGQTWERAALLRLTPVIDTEGVGAAVVRRLVPFVFPKTVSMTAVDELFAMKQRVTAEAVGDGFDVKRGRGGIREVEFVAQSLQLLCGGRMPELRRGSTVDVLLVLEDAGLLPHAQVRMLIESYEYLRRVEHALQYVEDRQTQLLPHAGALRDRIAQSLAAFDVEPGHARRQFNATLEHHRRVVHEAFEALLGSGRHAPPPDARAALDRTSTDAERERALVALGFVDGARALSLLRVLERRRGSPLSPRVLVETPGAADFAAHLVDQMGKSPDPLASLARLPDLFLEPLPRALLARLAEDKRLLSLVVRLLAVSAPLSRLLLRHQGLEAVLLRGLGAPRLRHVAMRAELRDPIDVEATPPDDEARLVRMRVVQARLSLPVALAFFAGRIDVTGASHRLSSIADVLLQEALTIAMERVARRHGALPGARFTVCAMGSLGGRELGFFRDVDLLFVYDGAGETTGPKPIGPSEWAARTAQQLIWALSAPLAEGACYPVDSRLRPSGNQGALTVSLDAFQAYHAQRSQLWERQALLRLRPVAGDASLGAAIEAAARAAAFQPPPPALGMRLLDMRARMVAERTTPAGIDLKLGEGGIADVEFAVQGLQLAHGGRDPRLWCASTRRALARLARRGYLPRDDAATLRTALDEISRAREAIALIDDKRAVAVTRTDPRLEMMVRARLVSDVRDGEALYDRLVGAAARIREVSSRVLVRLT